MKKLFLFLSIVILCSVTSCVSVNKFVDSNVVNIEVKGGNTFVPKDSLAIFNAFK